MRKTQKLVNKLLIELERTGIPLTACIKVGISRSTYYRWRQDDLDFMALANEAIRIGRENVTDLAESKLVKNINDGNQRAIEFQLRHNDPRYKYFSQLEFAKTLTNQSQEGDDKMSLLQFLIDETFDTMGLDKIRILAGKDEGISTFSQQINPLDQEKIELAANKLMASKFIQTLSKSEIARRSKLGATPNNPEEDTVQ